MAPNATKDTADLALMAAGALTRFLIPHVTASSKPKVPGGSPPEGAEMKDILSSEATVSKVTESAGTLFVGELT